MTHWAIVSGKENGVPYVLAAIDRKSTAFQTMPNGEVRKIGVSLAKKFTVIPERNLVALNSGLREATHEAICEIMAYAQKNASMRQLAEVGGHKLAEEIRALRSNSGLEYNNTLCNSAIAIARVKDEAEAAFVQYAPAEKPCLTWDMFNYGVSYLHPSKYTRDACRKYDERTIPIVVALETIVRSHEQARTDSPDSVSKEFDILLLTPDRKPAELQIDYEFGRPVVKRAVPITKNFVPWQAGNLSEMIEA